METDVNYPDNVIAAARKAATDRPDDISAAVAQLVRDVKKLPNYAVVVRDLMVMAAAKQLIYDQRRRENLRIVDRAEETVKSMPKVSPRTAQHIVCAGNSTTMQARYMELYMYRIGGHTLGSLRLEQLEPLVNSMQSSVDGLTRNINLVRRVQKLAGSAVARNPKATVLNTVTGPAMLAAFREFKIDPTAQAS